MIPVKDRLYDMMAILKIKQVDISEKTNISKSLISSYVSGHKIPKADKIIIIANAFGINPMWLMGVENVSMRNEIESNAILDVEITDLSTEDKITMLKYSKLSQIGKDAVNALIDFYTKKDEKE